MKKKQREALKRLYFDACMAEWARAAGDVRDFGLPDWKGAELSLAQNAEVTS